MTWCSLTTPGTHPFRRGVMAPPIDALTEEGYDMTFGTNVVGSLILRRILVADILTFQIIGHFYLTELLVPALYKASTPERKSRVVNFSSQIGILGASAFGSGLIFSTFKDSPTRRRLSGSALYGQSKLVSPFCALQLPKLT